MRTRSLIRPWRVLVFNSILFPVLAVDARMLRMPDVSAEEIAFVYAGDIWIVPKAGGSARRLSSPEGEETFPRFSPDGNLIAFSANYDGNTDVYVIPRTGGLPQRVTHHPMPDRMLDWYPAGDALLVSSPMESGRQRFNQLFRVGAAGGLPERLPVPFGEFASLSPDGKILAFMPRSRDFRTWKRYRGGMAPDIWLFDLTSLASENITSSPANDAHPMWYGKTLYFLSDRGPEKRYNIWSYDLDRKSFRQITKLTEEDIHFPAIGPEDIVYEAGGRLYLLSLRDSRIREVKVEVVTDARTLRPRTESVARAITDADLSPTGKRALFAARGEIFTVPAENGVIRNLTRDSGVAERTPQWSPDGEWVAYWSDRSGEYELTLRKADGSGEEQKLTQLGPGFRYTPFWSPDSRKLAFVDQAQRIQVLLRDTGEVIQIDHGLYMSHGPLSTFRVNWSGDSRWIAYSMDTDRRTRAIVLYDLQNRTRHQVTSGYWDDSEPVFDPEGSYLFFLTNREMTPLYSDFDNSWVYANATRIAALCLKTDTPSPLAPRNDDETAGGSKDKDRDKEKAKGESDGKGQEPEGKPSAEGQAKPAGDAAGKEAPKPVEIHLEGMESRVVVLPPEAGNYAGLRAAPGKVIYRRFPRTGSSPKAKPDLVYWDLKERKEETILAGADWFTLSADRNKLLVRQENNFAILDVKPNQKVEKPLRTAELETTVDPRAEWRQIFNDAWRFERDYFYDPNMHGVDWSEMRRRYSRLLDDCVTRWDLNFVIGELIAELDASHTYRGGGDVESPKERGVGLLGVDWELADGAYRIRRIIRGAPWDTEVRSPLAQPGVNVKEGDYILAVNGVPLDTSRDPWASFQGLAGKTVQLTVNSTPSQEGARQVLVEALSSEDRLRHLEWIEGHRRRVEEASGGKVGYIYVPSTGLDGQAELARQFYAQFDKPGLIIDERFNSGGQIPDRFIELLNRPALSFWAVRDGKDWAWPPVAHFGPKVMLINGWSGSGGDAFPYYFRKVGLGPLIGTTTWGGLIGISGVPGLVDGGGVTAPTFRMYDTEGKWFEEGRGVKPDIEVVEDPTSMAKGTDPQLERAIQEVLRLLETNPPVQPKRPPYEDRSR